MLTPVFIHRLLNFVTVSMDEPFEQCIGPCSWKFDLCQDTTQSASDMWSVSFSGATLQRVVRCICVFVCVCVCVCV